MEQKFRSNLQVTPGQLNSSYLYLKFLASPPLLSLLSLPCLLLPLLSPFSPPPLLYISFDTPRIGSSFFGKGIDFSGPFSSGQAANLSFGQLSFGMTSGWETSYLFGQEFGTYYLKKREERKKERERRKREDRLFVLLC